MQTTLILTLHIIVCVLLVILVLLQAGKEGMGVIFGGGNTSVFGSTGAGGILAKLTALMAVIFVVTSLSYTFVTSPRPSTESTILDVKIEDTATSAGNAAPASTVPSTPDTAAPALTPAKPEASAPTAKPDAAAPATPEAPQPSAATPATAAEPKAAAPKAPETPSKPDTPAAATPNASTAAPMPPQPNPDKPTLPEKK